MATTLVSQLSSVIPTDRHTRLQTTLENIQISSDGQSVHLSPVTESGVPASEDQKVERPLDEMATDTIAKYLGINAKYINECPPALRATNFNHWLQEKGDGDVVVAYDSQGIDTLYSPDKIILPGRRVAEVITNVFAPNDEIVRYHRDEKVLQLDIVKPEMTIDVPGNGIGDRPAEGVVGDITAAGVRIFVPTDFKTGQAPKISTFMNRLVCTNGMVVAQEDDEIRLKGMTVDDILEEMEERAQEVLAGLPQHMEAYRETANMQVPGNPVAFIRQIGRERGFSATIIDKALDHAAGFIDYQWTLYDVLQIFTELANTSRFTTANKLQEFGGDITTYSDDFLRRCLSCERPLATHTH